LTTKKFEVEFEDGTSIEGDSPEVFSDEILTSDSRPVSVSMSFSNLADDSRTSVALHHGSSSYYDNRIKISGEDTKWLNANFQALKDCVAKVRPQGSWVIRHPTLLLNLIALGIGCLGMLIIDLGLEILVRTTALGSFRINAPPWLTSIRSSWLMYPVGWVLRWITGYFWGAQCVRNWLLNMWPSVEFDFGAVHLQTEKKKRERLNAVWVLVTVPILVTLFYDLAKAHGIIKI
jgi:hypothetical protein